MKLMNVMLFFVLILSVINFSFADTYEGFEIQDDIEVKTLYESKVDYFTFILISSFSIVFVAFFFVFYRNYWIIKKEFED